MHMISSNSSGRHRLVAHKLPKNYRLVEEVGCTQKSPLAWRKVLQKQGFKLDRGHEIVLGSSVGLHWHRPNGTIAHTGNWAATSFVLIEKLPKPAAPKSEKRQSKSRTAHKRRIAWLLKEYKLLEKAALRTPHPYVTEQLSSASDHMRRIIADLSQAMRFDV
jgi:hypothetical protein